MSKSCRANQISYIHTIHWTLTLFRIHGLLSKLAILLSWIRFQIPYLLPPLLSCLHSWYRNSLYVWKCEMTHRYVSVHAYLMQGVTMISTKKSLREEGGGKVVGQCLETCSPKQPTAKFSCHRFPLEDNCPRMSYLLTHRLICYRTNIHSLPR